jgi:hypothetical protein
LDQTRQLAEQVSEEVSNSTLAVIQQSNSERIAQEQQFFNSIQDVARNLEQTTQDQEAQLEQQRQETAQLQEQATASFLQIRPSS